MDISLQIAGILGPILIALSVTEYKNFKIWQGIQPSVVYLNGLLFLIAGMVVIRFHNFWKFNWTILITILGWQLLLIGLYRMILPNGKQVEKPAIANLIFILMFIIGSFLSVKAFFL